MSSSPKKLCLINASADLVQVSEILKHLRPWQERNLLLVWEQSSVLPGEVLEKNLLNFLRLADGVVFWVSSDLLVEPLYLFCQENAAELPNNSKIILIQARHVNWESDEFLVRWRNNLIPANGQPLPTDDPAGMDAWMEQTAGELATQLGLPRQKKPNAVSFWKKGSFWTWFFIICTFIVALLAYLNDRGIYPRKEEMADFPPSLIAEKPMCDFPAEFDSTKLYILITRFEDYANKSETECYGRSIESRIDEVKNREKLPIRICYIDSLSPNQSDEAARLRDFHHADVIVWGKLRNAGSNCQADGICLNFIPSDTLIRYAGGQVPKKIDNQYELLVSAEKLENGLISMGKESFDSWLLEMSNLKIGKIKPEFYRILEEWPLDKRVQEYVSRSGLFSSLKRYESAISDLDKAIQLNSKIAMAYNNRGTSKVGLKQYQAAVLDYDKAIQLNSKIAMAYNSRGAAKNYLEQYQAAILDYDKAIQLDTTDASAYNNRGAAKNYLKQYQAAILDYDKAIQFNPTDASAYSNRGVAKSYLKQYQAAVLDCDKAIQLDPTFALSYNNRGAAKNYLKQYQAAILDCEQAIQLDPNCALAYGNRGFAKMELKQYQAAILDYDRAIQLDSNSALYHINRGGVKIYLKQYQAAFSDIDKAIQLDPTGALAYNKRGFAKVELKQYQAAISDFSKAIQLDSNSAMDYGNRGFAKAELKLYQTAISDYDKAIQLDSNFALAYKQRGPLKFYSQQPQAAILDYDKAIQLDSIDALTYNLRGMTKHFLKLYDAAIQDYSKAIKLDPGNAGFYLNRSLAYEGQGSHFKAKRDKIYKTCIESPLRSFFVIAITVLAIILLVYYFFVKIKIWRKKSDEKTNKKRIKPKRK